MAEKVSVSPSVAVFECQNCHAFMAEQDMNPLPEQGILERVGPGEPMPHGECPGCRAVVHQAEFPRAVLAMVRRLNHILTSDCSGRSLDNEGDRAVVAVILAGALERS